jgi:DnaJ domain
MEVNMSDELVKCYALLGVSPGVSAQELKAAHRDLSKVWHPDRFAHDPRLQEKAQEKLKEINEAYDQLRSGKAQRRAQPPRSTSRPYSPPMDDHFGQQNETVPRSSRSVRAGKIRWPLILAPVLVFGLVFLVVSRSLLSPGGQLVQPPSQAGQPSSSPEETDQQSQRRTSPSTIELQKGKDRTEHKPEIKVSSEAPAAQQNVTPIPTVSVMIDPSNGMLARPDCPKKSRMTYVSGNEPHEYCAVHLAPPAVQAPPKESRIKSLAKRLASPDTWHTPKGKSGNSNKDD